MSDVHLSAVAKELSEALELDHPPVQVSYLDSPPPQVAEHPGSVPSVCTFFAEGERRTFYAGSKAHEDCEIGAFVLGIPPEDELGKRLMSTLGTMQQEGYLEPGEEAKVPHNAKAPKYVAYGPLGSLPVPPTNVLLFARPKSAMLALEAVHFNSPMNGRPMCAIMPVLNAGAKVAFSMGCIGSRTYTQMGDDRMVVGIRGDYLDQFLSAVRKVRHANDLVGKEDADRKRASEAKRSARSTGSVGQRSRARSA
jgi:uncharacterized protein (DUF169 family)